MSETSPTAPSETSPTAQPVASPEGDALEADPAEADLQAPLEALLLIADEPVSEVTLATTLEVPVRVVSDTLAELADFYQRTGRGFELRPVAAGWRYYTRAEHADLVGRHVLQGQQAKLSRPALETLAVVAYLQPVSRSRISAVRGVNADGVIRTLLTRELIAETGAEESGATLFSTTDYFLERMGLQSLGELPELAPYLPEAGELEAELSELAVAGDHPAPSGPSAQDQSDVAPAGDDVAPVGDDLR